MASTSADPQKRLSDFLKDQQEPFILEVYLLERGYSKRRNCTQHHDDSGKVTLKRSASSASNKLTTTSRKILLPFSKVLKAGFKKLANFHSESEKTRNSENRNEDVNVPDPRTGRVIGQAAPEKEPGSSASSSTVFNSCSEVDEEETSISPYREPPSFSSDPCQSWNVCSAIEDRYELKFLLAASLPLFFFFYLQRWHEGLLAKLKNQTES